MSQREWLVFMASAQGYEANEDDTDIDLVWVIRNYASRGGCPTLQCLGPKTAITRRNHEVVRHKY